MTNDLYLIAHKVRGEPAFDIAQHMTCPKCDGQCHFTVETSDYPDCVDCSACDGIGHWWIIPTSGHRAFPYWDCKLADVEDDMILMLDAWEDGFTRCPPQMPPGLRDHYTTEREAATDLIKVLGLIHKPLAPAAPIKRRF